MGTGNMRKSRSHDHLREISKKAPSTLLCLTEGRGPTQMSTNGHGMDVAVQMPNSELTSVMVTADLHLPEEQDQAQGTRSRTQDQVLEHPEKNMGGVLERVGADLPLGSSAKADLLEEVESLNRITTWVKMASKNTSISPLNMVDEAEQPPLGICSAIRSEGLERGLYVNGSGECEGDLKEGLYPFKDAHYVEQEDVLEDGALPEPRMKQFCMKRMLEVQVIKACNLPVASTPENPVYVCELRLDEQATSTRCVTGSHVDREVNFSAPLSLRVDQSTICEVLDGRSGPDGPQIVCTLFECDRYLRSNVVGQSVVLLSDLIKEGQKRSATGKMLKVRCYFVGSDGSELVDSEGISSTIILYFHAENFQWQHRSIPTLQEIMATCEDVNLKLQHLPKNTKRGEALSMESFLDAERASHEGDVLKKKTILEESEDHDVKRFEIYCWREELEKVMDSIWASIIIISIILFDLCQLLFYLLMPKDKTGETFAQKAITLFILTFFLCELVLRRIAKGRRFWSELWNSFDFCILVTSAVLFFVKYTTAIDNADLDAEISGINVLRIFSRFVVFVRVLKVMNSLHRSQMLSGKVTQAIRTKVSQNRRRYKKHGFDLDLTYITNRVIAMSVPAFGGHSAYRNDIHVVSRFLSYMHYGHMYVFNLCDSFASSDGALGNYNPKVFFEQVLRIPIEDHSPPLLSELLKFCSEATKFMEDDPRNVVAVHCKGGKGRTGVCIAALLLWTGHRRCALDALELFTVRRTQNYNPEEGLDSNMANKRTQYGNQTVEGPSQIRYVHYMEAILYGGVEPHSLTMLFLKGINLMLGMQHAKNSWKVSFMVMCNRSVVFSSGIIDLCCCNLGKQNFPVQTLVWGDVRMDFYVHKQDLMGRKTKKLLFFNVWNTSFYPGKTELVFPKKKLDILSKDRNHTTVDKDFELTLHISENVSEDGCDKLQINQEMLQIFSKYGTKITLRRGELITWGHTNNERLILIKNGFCNAVIEETLEANFLEPHLHGKEVGSCINSEDRYTRMPQSLIAGAGMVIGLAQFLSKGELCTFHDYVVASETVEIIELNRFCAEGRQINIDTTDIEECDENSKHLSPMQSISSASASKSKPWCDWFSASVSNMVGLRCQCDNLSVTEMAALYKGLAINTAMQMTRIQVEVMKIGECKSLTDSQTILHDKEQTESLRMSCIQSFGLPVNEKLVLILKCRAQTNEFLSRKCRFVCLSNYVFLDTDYYGPEVNPSSVHFKVSDIKKVSFSPEKKIVRVFVLRHKYMVKYHNRNKSALRKFADDIQGVVGHAANFLPLQRMWRDSQISPTYQEIMFEFDSEAQGTVVYNQLSRMCVKAEEACLRKQLKFLEDPVVNEVVKRCSASHFFHKGDEVTTEYRDSFLILRQGDLRLVSIFREESTFGFVGTGSAMGIAPFTLGKEPDHKAFAETDLVVVEVFRNEVDKFLSQHPLMEAHFWDMMCRVLSHDCKQIVEEAFPGEWIHRQRRENFELQGKTSMLMSFDARNHASLRNRQSSSSYMRNSLSKSMDAPKARFHDSAKTHVNRISFMTPLTYQAIEDDDLSWIHSTRMLPLSFDAGGSSRLLLLPERDLDAGVFAKKSPLVTKSSVSQITEIRSFADNSLVLLNQSSSKAVEGHDSSTRQLNKAVELPSTRQLKAVEGRGDGDSHRSLLMPPESDDSCIWATRLGLHNEAMAPGPSPALLQGRLSPTLSERHLHGCCLPSESSQGSKSAEISIVPMKELEVVLIAGRKDEATHQRTLPGGIFEGLLHVGKGIMSRMSLDTGSKAVVSSASQDGSLHNANHKYHGNGDGSATSIII